VEMHGTVSIPHGRAIGMLYGGQGGGVEKLDLLFLDVIL